MKIIQFFVTWAGASGVLAAADVPWGSGRWWAILACLCVIAVAHHIGGTEECIRKQRVYRKAARVQVTHDGDGKIYADGEFLFEVMIRDGDEVARRINELIDKPKVTTNMKWLCSVCGLVPVDRCPKCGLKQGIK